MYTHTKFDHQFFDSPRPSVSYAICSTPRCGSSLLSEALCLTGLAGAPTEFFDDQTKQGFIKKWQNNNRLSYLDLLMENKTSPNGVFGFKCHFHQYQNAFGLSAIPIELPSLKYISIKRRNRVRQAVSYARAIQTNQWAITHQSTNDSPEFNFVQIKTLLERIQKEERQWEAFFSNHNIQPFRLVYEGFSSDVPAAVSDCFAHLGLEVPADWQLPELTLKKQADELSEDWVQRFLKERGS